MVDDIQEKPKQTDLQIVEGDLKGSSNPPVFNCHVIISFNESSGQMSARLASLPQIKATASSERDVLREIVSRFKEFAKQHESSIPWTDDPDVASDNEMERWLPVHL